MRYALQLAGRHKIVLVVALGAVLRLYLVCTAVGINSDAFKYARTAERMARQGVLSGMRGDHVWPYHPVNRRLIVYPFLGSLLLPLAGDPVLALRLVSAVSGTALIWVVYAVSRELFEQEGVALLAAGLAAFQPEFAAASAAVYREVLMALLLMAAFLMVLWALRRKRGWAVMACASGALFFVSFLTRPDGAAAAVATLFVVLVLARSVKWRKRLAICAAMALTFLVLETPYVLWLHKTTGQYMVTQWQANVGVSEVESASRFLLEQHGGTNGAHE